MRYLNLNPDHFTSCRVSLKPFVNKSYIVIEDDDRGVGGPLSSSSIVLSRSIDCQLKSEVLQYWKDRVSVGLNPESDWSVSIAYTTVRGKDLTGRELQPLILPTIYPGRDFQPRLLWLCDDAINSSLSLVQENLARAGSDDLIVCSYFLVLLTRRVKRGGINHDNCVGWTDPAVLESKVSIIYSRRLPLTIHNSPSLFYSL